MSLDQIAEEIGVIVQEQTDNSDFGRTGTNQDALDREELTERMMDDYDGGL